MAKVDPAVRRISGIALSLSLTLVLCSCAHIESAEPDVDVSEWNELVNVVLKEWYILPDKRVVDAGNVTFRVDNQGHMDHEFIIIKTAMPVHDLPVVDEGLNEKKAGKLIAELEDVSPGESRIFTVRLAPGNYVLFCNKVEKEDHKVISHYRHGMRVGFTVK